ncbi:hypothetical protein BpHYR1_042824 [Brachionus plicatilis]|uniref:Uncharacterized protein n=1 Tax=Brachionus plicatilis TaxID=10195 RepID=A0A3M7QQU0_BRAPC|nr:hypothetical protein BpHYR1_042824 [Brachionus plicatilis]
MVSMVLVPYGINPNFDNVPRVMVTSLRILKKIVQHTLEKILSPFYLQNYSSTLFSFLSLLNKY